MRTHAGYVFVKTLLIIAYVSASGVPSIETHERQDMRQCRDEATEIFNKVKAGTVRAWCVRIGR